MRGHSINDLLQAAHWRGKHYNRAARRRGEARKRNAMTIGHRLEAGCGIIRAQSDVRSNVPRDQLAEGAEAYKANDCARSGIAAALHELTSARLRGQRRSAGGQPLARQRL